MMNPILRREMKTSFRSAKIFIGTSIYVFVMVSIAAAGILLTNSFIRMSQSGFTPAGAMVVYSIISGLQLFLIYVVVPVVAGGSISGERERQTLDILLMTKMKGKDIVRGKLMSSLMVIGLMLTATMPVYGIIFYYGGINLTGFVITMIFLMAHAFYVGSISLFFSAKLKKGAVATIVTYLMLIGMNMIIGIISGMGFMVMLMGLSVTRANSGNVHISQEAVKTVFDVLGYLASSMSTSNSYLSLIGTVTGTKEFNSFFEMFSAAGSSKFISVIGEYLSMWIFNICFVTAVGIVFQSFTSRSLTSKRIQPRRINRKR